jgi:hypothetical protein
VGGGGAAVTPKNITGTHSMSLCRSRDLRKKKTPFKGVLKTATFSGSSIFSAFIRREGICSVICIFPVSFFIIFQVTFILLSDLALYVYYKAVSLASSIALLRILQYLT